MAFEPDEWRRGLLRSSTFVAAVLGSVCLIAFYSSMVQTPALYAINIVALLTVWCSALSKKMSVRTHATLLVAAGMSLHFASLSYAGFRVVTPLTGGFVMTTAALLAERRGAAVTWLLLVLGDGLHVHALGDGGGLPAWPESVDVAWRYVVTMALFNGFIGAGVTAAVEMLSVKVAELDAHVVSLEAAREDLQSEREKVIALQKMDLVGKLAAGIAHDFNNDLQVIIGWGYMLAEDAEEVGDHELVEACEQIKAASDHASNLVTQLLTLGKRHVGLPEEIQLGLFIERMTPSIRRLLSSDISLEVTTKHDSAALIDPTQLHQVMLNLCLNARDAMPEGGHLSVSLHECEGEVCLSVRDTGAGIHEDIQSQIFTPFFSTKGVERGTGLGLSTVRQIAEDAGGSVAVESVPGEGSVFTVRLPSIAPSSSPEGSEHDLVRHRLDGLDVMIVEDDAAVRDIMTRALEGAGADVRVAVDALDAIIELEDRMADVIFSDAIMPRGGVTPLYEWLADLGDDAAPLILCSAYIESELVRRGVMAEEIMLLRKPFSPGMLVQAAAELRG